MVRRPVARPAARGDGSADVSVCAPPAAASRTAHVQDAYASAGGAWADGPEAAYLRLARLAVDALPGPLTGRLVLDVGAGTGCASWWVARRGGRPVALDPAMGMLSQAVSRRRHMSGGPTLAAAAGVAERLPFSARRFSAAVAAFVLSHVADPVAALREIRRTLLPGGWLTCIGFRAEPQHPAKARVDQVARRFGFETPAWYFELKAREARVAEPAPLAAIAAAAQLVKVRVIERRVSTGTDTPEALVRWRLGMPHLAPFVAGLSVSTRSRLHQDACAALGDHPPPWRPAVLILSSRAPA